MKREIGGFFEFPSLDKEYCEKSCMAWLTSNYPSCVYLRDGRQALFAVGHAVSKITNTIWLPGYLCRSVLQPFKQLGLRVHFYRHKHPLTPQIDEKIRNSIVLIIDFFGAETVSNDQIMEILNRNNVVIVDISHSLLANNRFDVTHENLFLVASLRKTLPIPDGGAVFSSLNTDIELTLGYPERYEQIVEAMMVKKRFLEKTTHDEKVRDYYLGLSKKYESDKDEEVIALQSMPEISSRIMDCISHESILDQRRKNLEYLCKNIGDEDALLYSQKEMPGAFFLPIVFGNREVRDQARMEFIKKRIYPPIHWQSDLITLPYECDISNRILSIPIDQRYCQEDMERILGVLKKVI